MEARGVVCWRPRIVSRIFSSSLSLFLFSLTVLCALYDCIIIRSSRLALNSFAKALSDFVANRNRVGTETARSKLPQQSGRALLNSSTTPNSPIHPLHSLKSSSVNSQLPRKRPSQRLNPIKTTSFDPRTLFLETDAPKASNYTSCEGVHTIERERGRRGETSQHHTRLHSRRSTILPSKQPLAVFSRKRNDQRPALKGTPSANDPRSKPSFSSLKPHHQHLQTNPNPTSTHSTRTYPSTQPNTSESSSSLRNPTQNRFQKRNETRHFQSSM